MEVALLTIEQKNSLIGQQYQQDCFFNPVQDCNGDWIISQQEIDQCINPDFDWIKNLPLIDWCGPYIPVSGDTANYFDQFFSGNTGE